MGSRLIGYGSYLPEKVVTNFDLEKMVDTSDEWIVQRTGMRERHFARDDETVVDMATTAAQRALEKAAARYQGTTLPCWSCREADRPWRCLTEWDRERKRAGRARL